MIEKIYDIDKLYFARLAVVENTGIQTIKCVCVELIQCGLQKPIFLRNIKNDLVYSMYTSNMKVGTIFVSARDLIPARTIFNKKCFKHLNKDLADKVAIELYKKPENRNLKNVLIDICKLNKIKITKSQKIAEEINNVL